MSLVFALSPILAVALGGLLLMLTEAFGRPGVATSAAGPVVDVGAGRGAELGLGAAVALFAGAVLSVAVWLVGPASIPGVVDLAPYLILDRYALFFCFVICLGGALAALLAAGYLPEHRIERGEFFPLLLLSTVGAMGLVAAGDVLTLFLALETMSLGVYCMIALRRVPRSVEASLKYFLLGSFAAALLLFGAALLYGVTGRTDLAGIGEALGAVASRGSGASVATVLIATTLVIVGLAFKVSAVPFHMWTPDAYEGAPTPVTSYMAVVVKAAAFAVLVRVLQSAFGGVHLSSWGSGWPPVVALLAVLTMTVGNVVAGRQESVKRMLAYSSISHAGYALIAVAALPNSEHGVPSTMFYMLAYTASTAGAFGALILAGRYRAEAVHYDDFAGLGRRHPAVALAFSLFLVSLAGIPPTAGFFGKLYVFQAAIDAELYWLVVAGVVNSVLGAYYYVRVMVYMYMREPALGSVTATPMRSGSVVAALLLAAILVIGLGVFPGAGLEMARAAQLVP